MPFVGTQVKHYSASFFLFAKYILFALFTTTFFNFSLIGHLLISFLYVYWLIFISYLTPIKFVSKQALIRHLHKNMLFIFLFFNYSGQEKLTLLNMLMYNKFWIISEIASLIYVKDYFSLQLKSFDMSTTFL